MKKTSAILLAVTGWFAVIAQLWLMMQNSPLPAGEKILRFFSYFTVLTNLAVAIRFTTTVVRGDGTTHFFARAGVQSALTVYILVVGIVYHLMPVKKLLSLCLFLCCELCHRRKEEAKTNKDHH